MFSLAADRVLTNRAELNPDRERALAMTGVSDLPLVESGEQIDNDPTAGSPTVTLLRLLLPLNAQVWESSRAALEA